MGTLDDSPLVVPVAHMWTRSRLPWIALPADAEVYDEAMPQARLVAIFNANQA
jgi:hypothetical protein